MERTQKEFYLHQQMKAIQEELGQEGDSPRGRRAHGRDREGADMSEEAEKKAMAELERLKKMPTFAGGDGRQELHRVADVDVPWDKRTKDRPDIAEVEKILDEDHYGLKKVEGAHPRVPGRAQARARDEGPDPLLRRPAGRRQDVARTVDRRVARAGSSSACRSAASATRRRSAGTGGRTSARFPGRIIQRHEEGRDAKNPVFLLDEVDKMAIGLPGRPVVGAPRGARPRAEPRVQRPLSRRATSTSRRSCSSRRRTCSHPIPPAL